MQKTTEPSGARLLIPIRRHSPVGEKISLRPLLSATSRNPGLCVADWTGFASGTEALAAALTHATQRAGVSPSVAIPAYSCPSILAAAQHCGLNVVFMDLAKEQVFPGPQEVSKALDAGAGLVIQVDLFGVPAQIDDVMLLARARQALVIHDRAQALSGPGLHQTSPADYVIVSQGRGKPASLLGGGAAWACPEVGFREFSRLHWPEVSWHPRRVAMQAFAHNVLLNPLLFGFVASLPNLKLGETHLTPLASIRRFPDRWLRAAAMQANDALSKDGAREVRTRELLQSVSRLSPSMLPGLLNCTDVIGLNRLPVLCQTQQHAERVATLGRQYGISRMYGRTLPEFAGQEESLIRAKFPNSHAVSRRLVTLPTHSRLTATERNRLLEILFHG